MLLYLHFHNLFIRIFRRIIKIKQNQQIKLMNLLPTFFLNNTTAYILLLFISHQRNISIQSGFLLIA